MFTVLTEVGQAQIFNNVHMCLLLSLLGKASILYIVELFDTFGF